MASRYLQINIQNKYTTRLKLSLKSLVAQTAGAYPGFRGTKRLGALLLHLDGMLVNRRLPTNILSGYPDSLH